MGKDWGSLFQTRGQPQSDTETSEAERTVGQIQDALRRWPALQRRDFRVYLKGHTAAGPMSGGAPTSI